MCYEQNKAERPCGYRYEFGYQVSQNAGSKISVDLSGQLHNRRDLLAKLNSNVPHTSDTELLKDCWLRWGASMAEHLVGDYALALRDESRRVTYLARNPLGVKPLYYRIDHGVLNYGFSIPKLREACRLPVTKDLDWAAAYMLDLSFDITQTPYREIRKLPPGHWLTLEDGCNVKIERYHHWRDNAPFSTRRSSDWVDAYREVLEEAIRCRMDPDAPIGTENSGGIDSATITAYLADFLGEPGDRLHCFGFALAEQEPSFILETSQAKRIRHNHIDTEWGEEPDMIARAITAIGHPPEQLNSTSHIAFYKQCQLNGIRSLFSGFGGDEVVTNQGEKLKLELLDGHHYGALWDILAGSPVLRSLRLVRAILAGRSPPAQNAVMAENRRRNWQNQLVRTEVVERLGLRGRYMQRAIYDAPYRRINDLVLQHHLGVMTYVARLESCTAMAGAYGVDYRWPLWDVRLVQQYLSTPSIEKYGSGGIGRFLHRRAIDGIVPHRVAWKASKDMGYTQQRMRLRASTSASIIRDLEQLESSIHAQLPSLIDMNILRKYASIVAAGDRQSELPFLSRAIRNARWINEWLSTSDAP